MSYPILVSHLNEYRKERFEYALSIFKKAKEDKSIRNVDYLEMKDAFGRAIDYAFRKSLPDVDFDEAPEEVSDLYWKSVSNLHDVIAAHKKVSKVKNREHEYVKAYQALMDELIQLSLDVKDMKSMIVKGRLPSVKEVSESEADKRTCACCFRKQALSKNGTMVHHGFQRPGDGYQTASCYGINFKPLERSNEGLIAMIKLINEDIVNKENSLSGIKKAIEFFELDEKNKKLISIKEDNPDFKYVKRRRIEGMEYELRSLKRDLAMFEKALNEWKQTEFI